jgi:hypothetical protein
MALNVDVSAVLASLTTAGLQAVLCKLPPRGARFPGDEQDIAMFIERSKNKNVVCYRAVFTERSQCRLNPQAPLDAYWLDVDPEYVKANRKAGKSDDRCELNFIDRTMAYGHSVNEITEVQGMTVVDISFVALKDRTLKLCAVKETATGEVWPLLLATVDGKPSVVSRIFVNSTENFIGLPSVQYVEIFGIDLFSGEASYEKKLP